jgi:phosphohistidine phosphatase
MRRLFLLRHAKSSRDDPALADHERPLAPRGTRAAEAMAEHFRGEGISPDLVLCSSSRRTRETLDLISPALGDETDVEIERQLYGALAGELLERVRAVDDGVESVMLIGHNPAIEQLALTLAGRGEKLDEMRSKFPTAALAALEFDGPWRGLGPGDAELTAFVKPKQLAEG